MTHWSNDLEGDPSSEPTRSAAESVVISARMYKENSSLFLTQWFSRRLSNSNWTVGVGPLKLSEHSQKELIVSEIHGPLGSQVYISNLERKASKKLQKSNSNPSAATSTSASSAASISIAPAVSYYVGDETTLYQKYEKYRIIMCLDISQSSYSATEHGIPRTLLIDSLLLTVDALIKSMAGEPNIISVSISIIAHRPETEDTYLVWMGEIKANSNIAILRKIVYAKIDSMELQIMKSTMKKSYATSPSAAVQRFPDMGSFLKAVEYHSNLLPIDSCPISFLFTTGNLNIEINPAVEHLAKSQIPLNIVVETTSSRRSAGFHADLSGLALLAKCSYGCGKLIQISTTDLAAIRSQIVDSLSQNTLNQSKLLSIFYIPYFINERKDKAASSSAAADISSSSSQSIEINSYSLNECTLEHVIVARIKEGFKIKSFFVENISHTQLMDLASNPKFNYDPKKTIVVLEKYVTKLTKLIYEVQFQQVTVKRSYSKSNYGDLTKFIEPLWLFETTDSDLCWNRGLIQVFVRKSMSSFYFDVRDDKTSKKINYVVTSICQLDKRLGDILCIPELAGKTSYLLSPSESSSNLGVDLGGSSGGGSGGGYRETDRGNRDRDSAPISAKMLTAKIDIVEEVCRFDVEVKFMFYLRNAPKFQLRQKNVAGEGSASFHLSSKKLATNDQVISDIENFLQSNLPNVDYSRVSDMKWCLVYNNTPSSKSTLSESANSRSKMFAFSSNQLTNAEYGIFLVKVEETHCGFISVSLLRIVKGVGSQHHLATTICNEIKNILIKHGFDPYKLNSDLSLLILSQNENKYHRNALSCYQSTVLTLSIPNLTPGLKSLIIQDLLYSKVLYSKLQLVENSHKSVGDGRRGGGGGGTNATYNGSIDGDTSVESDRALTDSKGGSQFLFMSVVVGKNPFGISKSDSLIHCKITFIHSQCEIEYYWFSGCNGSQYISHESQLWQKNAEEIMKQTESYIKLSVEYDKNILLMYRYVSELINSGRQQHKCPESWISHIISNCTSDSIGLSGFKSFKGNEHYWHKLNEVLMEMLFQCCCKSTAGTIGRSIFVDKEGNESLISKGKYCGFYIKEFELFVLLEAPSMMPSTSSGLLGQSFNIGVYYVYFPRLALGKFQPHSLSEDFLKESDKYSAMVENFAGAMHSNIKPNFDNLISTIKKSLEQTHLNNFAKLLYFALVQNFVIHPDDIQMGLEQCQFIAPQIMAPGSHEVKQNQYISDVNISAMYQELRKMFGYFNEIQQKLDGIEADMSKLADANIKKSLEVQILKLDDLETFLRQSFISTVGQFIDSVVDSNLFVCNDQIQSTVRKSMELDKFSLIADVDESINEINRCEKAAFVKLTLDSFTPNFTPITFSSSVKELVQALIQVCLTSDISDVFIHIVYVFSSAEDIFTVKNLKKNSGLSSKLSDANEETSNANSNTNNSSNRKNSKSAFKLSYESRISSKSGFMQSYESGLKISNNFATSTQSSAHPSDPLFDKIRVKIKLFCSLNILYAIFWNQSIKFTSPSIADEKDSKKMAIVTVNKDDASTTKLFFDHIRDLTSNYKYNIDVKDDIIYVLSIGTSKTTNAAKLHDTMVRQTIDREITKKYNSERLENGSHIIRYSNPKMPHVFAWIVIVPSHIAFKFGLNKTLVDYVSSTEVSFGIQLYYLCDYKESDLTAVETDIKTTLGRICFRVNQRILLEELNDTSNVCPYLIKPLDEGSRPKVSHQSSSFSTLRSSADKSSASGPSNGPHMMHNRFKQRGAPAQTAYNSSIKPLQTGAESSLKQSGQHSSNNSGGGGETATKLRPSMPTLTSFSSTATKPDTILAPSSTSTSVETKSDKSSTTPTSSNSISGGGGSSSSSSDSNTINTSSSTNDSKFKKGMFACNLQEELSCPLYTEAGIHAELAIQKLESFEIFNQLFVNNREMYGNLFVSKDKKKDVFYMEFDRSQLKDSNHVRLRLYAIDSIDASTVKELRELLEDQILSLSASNMSLKLRQSAAVKPTFLSFLKHSSTNQISYKISLPPYISDVYFFCCLLRQHLLNTQLLSKLSVLPSAKDYLEERKEGIAKGNVSPFRDVSSSSLSGGASTSYSSPSNPIYFNRTNTDGCKTNILHPSVIGYVVPVSHFSQTQYLKSLEEEKEKEKVRQSRPNLTRGKKVSDSDIPIYNASKIHPAFFGLKPNSDIIKISNPDKEKDEYQALWDQNDFSLVYNHMDAVDESKRKVARGLVLLDIYPRAVLANGSANKLSSFSSGSPESIESDVGKLKEIYLSGSPFTLQKLSVTASSDFQFSSFPTNVPHQAAGAKSLEIVLKIFPIAKMQTGKDADKGQTVSQLSELFEQSVNQCIVTYAAERLLASKDFQKSVNRVGKQKYCMKQEDTIAIESSVIEALITDIYQVLNSTSSDAAAAATNIALSTATSSGASLSSSSTAGPGPLSVGRRSNIISTSTGFAELKSDESSSSSSSSSSLSSISSSSTAADTKLIHTILSFGYVSVPFELPRSLAISLRNSIVKQLPWLNENPNVAIIRSGFGSRVSDAQAALDYRNQWNGGGEEGSAINLAVSSSNTGPWSNENLRWVNFREHLRTLSSSSSSSSSNTCLIGGNDAEGGVKIGSNDDVGDDDDNTIATFCYNLFDQSFSSVDVGTAMSSNDYRLLPDLDASVTIPAMLRRRRSVLELSLTNKGIKVYYINVQLKFISGLCDTMTEATIKAVESFSKSQYLQLKSLGIVVDKSSANFKKSTVDNINISSISCVASNHNQLAKVHAVVRRLFWEQKLLNKLYKISSSVSAREADAKPGSSNFTSSFQYHYSSDSVLNDIDIDTWRLGKLYKSVCIKSTVKNDLLVPQIIKYQMDCLAIFCKEYEIDILPFGLAENHRQRSFDKNSSSVYSSFFAIFSIPQTGSILSTEFKFNCQGSFQTIIHRVLDVSDVIQSAFRQSTGSMAHSVRAVTMRDSDGDKLLGIAGISSSFSSSAPRSVIHQVHSHPTIKRYFSAISMSIMESYRSLLFLKRRKEVISQLSADLLFPALLSLGKVFRGNILTIQSKLGWSSEEDILSSSWTLPEPRSDSYKYNIWLDDQVSSESAGKDYSFYSGAVVKDSSSLFKLRSAKGAFCNHFVVKRLGSSGAVTVVTTGISFVKVIWDNRRINNASDLVVETISYESAISSSGDNNNNSSSSSISSSSRSGGEGSKRLAALDPLEILISDDIISVYLQHTCGASLADDFLFRIALDTIKQSYCGLLNDLQNALMFETLWSEADRSSITEVSLKQKEVSIDSRPLKILVGSSRVLLKLIPEFIEYRGIIQTISKNKDLRVQFILDLRSLNSDSLAEVWSYSSRAEELDKILKPLFSGGNNLSRVAGSGSEWLTDYISFLSKSRPSRRQPEVNEDFEEIVVHFDCVKKRAVLIVLSSSLERCNIYFLAHLLSSPSDVDSGIKDLSESLKSNLSKAAILYMLKQMSSVSI